MGTLCSLALVCRASETAQRLLRRSRQLKAPGVYPALVCPRTRLSNTPGGPSRGSDLKAVRQKPSAE